MQPAWHEEAIAKAHNRKGFDCGDAGMNMFLERFARQGHEQNAAKTFCAIADEQPDRVLGFYSLAPASIEHDSVPPAMTKGLARYTVPGFLLARLAVDTSVAGRGLGGQLILAAALRCIRVTEEVGGVLMVIDAKSARGQPRDPVARFHLGNGARLERLNFLGDRSDKGMQQSHGLMVNYLYARDRIEENHEAYAERGHVTASPAVRRLRPSPMVVVEAPAAGA